MKAFNIAGGSGVSQLRGQCRGQRATPALAGAPGATRQPVNPERGTQPWRHSQAAQGARLATRTHVTSLSAPSATVPPGQQPPPRDPELAQVDSCTAYPVLPNITLLRSSCKGRLKYEVEYGLMRGSSDNSYVIRLPGKASAVLVDVPSVPYSALFLDALEAQLPLTQIKTIVVTHLSPQALPTLEKLMTRLLQQAPDATVTVVLTNPALRLLQTTLGEKADKAYLLTQMKLVVGRSGSTVPLEDGSKLSLTLAPTPRWPDLMLVHHSASKLLFSSKLFSAHVLPTLVSQDDTAFDTGGWAKYSGDWRFFFECMLAPTASQAAAVFKNLELVAVPKPLQQLLSSTLPSGGLLGKLMSNFADLLGSSSPTAAASPSAVTAAAAAAAANDAPATSGGSVTRYEVCAICPRHGPVVQGSITQLVGDYRNWIAEQIKLAAAANVAVLYASAYGNTAALAQAISRGVTKGGVGVNTLNLEVSTLDEVSAAIRGASGFIIGSPTLGGHMPTQVQVALGAVVREMAAKNLPCGVFGSFGWSGEAVDEMEAKLRDSGFKFAFDAIRVKFKPTAKDLLTCEESGRNLALQVKRRQKSRESSASAAAKVAVASGSQLAMGRVIGSLCVVTAKYEDATSAMLASWVSQASFNPPGLTVAVKKDRQMEPLLIIGAKFGLSVLAEGKEKGVMKVLTKPFTPAQDRLAGLETAAAEQTGVALLKDANAVMECEVVDRMEAGDHWVLYGRVLGGKVQDEAAQTAVHHRKVGNHY